MTDVDRLEREHEEAEAAYTEADLAWGKAYHTAFCGAGVGPGPDKNHESWRTAEAKARWRAESARKNLLYTRERLRLARLGAPP